MVTRDPPNSLASPAAPAAQPGWPPATIPPASPPAAAPEPAEESGWSEENARVQQARLPFIRQTRRALQADGLGVFDQLPSERRLAAGINTRIYYTYPLLFYRLFPRVSLAQLRSLSLCGSYLFDYALCLDRLIDQPAHADLGTLLLGQQLQREGLALLAQLFAPGHRFWGYFDRYTAELMQAALCERARHYHLLTPYSRPELERLYAGKAALAKAAMAALALIDRSEPALARLAASHDDFYVGFQIFDDLQDWRPDYQSCRYSYPLTAALLRAGWQERTESAERPPAEEVGELLRGSGVLEECRALALEYLARAESRLETPDDGGWAAMLRATHQHISRFVFGSPDAPQVPPDAPDPYTWDGQTALVTTPVAAEWQPWLDPTRAPLVRDPRLLEIQLQHLCQSPPAPTLGLAVCQVGLAISASLERHPELEPALHLGMRPAELAWCQANHAWLEALLALALDAPPQNWASAPRQESAGWLSPSVGRFLGYHLVQSYRAERGALPSPQAALADYRRRLIG
jgi:hypothetical protein